MNNLKAEQFRKNMQKLSHTTPFSFWEALRISRFNYFVSSLKNQEVLPSPTIVQKETTIDLPKFDNFPGKENIEEFIRVLLQNFSPKDLIIFFNNINSLRLNPSDIEDKDKDTKFFKAYYDGENNAIFCQEYDYLYHELYE